MPRRYVVSLLLFLMGMSWVPGIRADRLEATRYPKYYHAPQSPFVPRMVKKKRPCRSIGTALCPPTRVKPPSYMLHVNRRS